jgi:hypothetical protein
VEATDKVSLSGSAFVRAFTQQTQREITNVGGIIPPGMSEYYPTSSAVFFGGGSLGVRYRMSNASAGLRGNGQLGDGGRRVGADLYGEKIFAGHYVAQGRTGVWEWKDDLRADREATNFQYVLGLGYRFFDKSQAMVEWQHDMNRVAGQRFRLMLWLTLAVLR